MNKLNENVLLCWQMLSLVQSAVIIIQLTRLSCNVSVFSVFIHSIVMFVSWNYVLITAWFSA